MGIIDTEYDEAKVMRLFKKEAFEEGLQKGEQIGRAEEKRKNEAYIETLRNQLLSAGITPATSDEKII